MKSPIFLFVLFISTIGCSHKYFNETQQGNMFLRNNKVYFQKKYNHPFSLNSLAKDIKSYNTPFGGFQIKQMESNSMKGVMVNYQFNWLILGDKKSKVPSVFKNPANASFEIQKINGSYKVTVDNIWFTSDSKNNKKNITLESLVTRKKGCCFTKSKKYIKILELIDKNFSTVFNSKTKGGNLRFQ